MNDDEITTEMWFTSQLKHHFLRTCFLILCMGVVLILLVSCTSPTVPHIEPITPTPKPTSENGGFNYEREQPMSFEKFREISCSPDSTTCEDNYKRYVESKKQELEMAFTDNRLNVSYEIHKVDIEYIDNAVTYQIFYTDNGLIKFISLPKRDKPNRMRINEHLVTGVIGGCNESTLTLKSVYYDNYPDSPNGFNVYNWEVVLKDGDIND